MIVVDSSVWIDLMRGRDTPEVRTFRSLEAPDDILVGDLILLEILQGTQNEYHAERVERNLRQFRIVPMLGTEIAVQAARNFRALRSSGVTIRKTADMIIATFCIERGHALLHADRDFSLIASHLDLATI